MVMQENIHSIVGTTDITTQHSTTFWHLVKWLTISKRVLRIETLCTTQRIYVFKTRRYMSGQQGQGKTVTKVICVIRALHHCPLGLLFKHLAGSKTL